MTLMVKDFVHEEMTKLGICMSESDFLKGWEMSDIDGSGELSIEEFVAGFSYLQESLCTKHVVNIDYSLKRIAMDMEARIDKFSEDVAELRVQGEEIMKSLELQELMQQAQALSLWLWQE